MNEFTSRVTLFANKFEITVYTDSINAIGHLQLGSKAKAAITLEVRRLTGKNVNVSSFKSHSELINKKLEEHGLNIDVYIGSGKSKKKLLTCAFAGKQIMRERKLEELMNE